MFWPRADFFSFLAKIRGNRHVYLSTEQPLIGFFPNRRNQPPVLCMCSEKTLYFAHAKNGKVSSYRLAGVIWGGGEFEFVLNP